MHTHKPARRRERRPWIGRRQFLRTIGFPRRGKRSKPFTVTVWRCLPIEVRP
jgi:hypothetical protein